MSRTRPRRGVMSLGLAAILVAAGGLIDPGSANPRGTATLPGGTATLPGSASPGGAATVAPADQAVAELLSGIDFVPSRGALDDTLGQAAPSELIAIAGGSEPTMNDAGYRLRAYRALALYPGPDTEAALRDAVVEHGQKSTGVDTLYLRAAMESLAIVAGADAVFDPVADARPPQPGRPRRSGAGPGRDRLRHRARPASDPAHGRDRPGSSPRPGPSPERSGRHGPGRQLTRGSPPWSVPGFK